MVCKSTPLVLSSDQSYNLHTEQSICYLGTSFLCHCWTFDVRFENVCLWHLCFTMLQGHNLNGNVSGAFVHQLVHPVLIGNIKHKLIQKTGSSLDLHEEFFKKFHFLSSRLHQFSWWISYDDEGFFSNSTTTN